MNNNTVTPQYGFQVASTGNGAYTFAYKQAPYGLKIILPMMVLAAFPAGFLVLSARLNFTAWVLLSLVLAAIAYGLLQATRRGGSFSVSGTEFAVAGQSYDRDHIHEVFIKVPGQNEQRTRIESSSVIVGSGVAGAMAVGAATAAQAGRAIIGGATDGIISGYRKKNYQIGFLYGERKIKLASGIAESTADAMFRKILEVAKY